MQDSFCQTEGFCCQTEDVCFLAAVFFCPAESCCQQAAAFRSQRQRIFSGGDLMAYQRKSSKHIAAAQERAANLQGIDPDLDFGSGLALDAYAAEIAAGNEFKAAGRE
jgi:hypothetical protein